MIKSFIDGKQNDWDLNLGCLAGGIDLLFIKVHNAHLTCSLRIPNDVLVSDTSQQADSYWAYVERMQRDLWEAHNLTRMFLNRQLQCQSIPEHF